MHRTRGKVTGRGSAGTIAASTALAAVSVVALAACGHNDSTASSTPTLKTSTTTASATPSATPSSAASSAHPAPPPAPTGTVAGTERPQPITPTASSDAHTSGKDKAFLDAVQKTGLHPDQQSALMTAQYICASEAAKVPSDQMMVNVNAMVGSDPSYDPAKMPLDQAGKAYVDAANQNYCNK